MPVFQRIYKDKEGRPGHRNAGMYLPHPQPQPEQAAEKLPGHASANGGTTDNRSWETFHPPRVVAPLQGFISWWSVTQGGASLCPGLGCISPSG
jgi:hypothetical protein